MTALGIRGCGKPSKCKIYNILRITEVILVENSVRKSLTLQTKRYNIIVILYLDRNAR